MFKKNSFFFRLSRFVNNIKRDGIIWSISRIFLKIFNEQNENERKKNKVLNYLITIYNYSVAHGIFKGMRLNKNIYWSRNDLITHILGVYEKHVLDQLIKFSKLDNSVFIDIGAADGYFAVGSAYSGLFKKVYAFEIQKEGREILSENAKVNKCEKNIIINPEANFKRLKNIVDEHKRAVVLIDIEGDEFSLLNDEILKLLSNCNIIVELHPSSVKNGYQKEKDLINSAKYLFNVSIIKRESYNPNFFKELDNFTDDERLVAFSEGRENNMCWLILETRN